MFRKAVPALAFSLLAATCALAQETPAKPANSGMTEIPLHRPITVSQGYHPVPSDNLASLLIGMSVFSGVSDTADLIGSVDDLVIGSDGHVAAVVLSVGGYLDTGEKSVAIDYTQLQWDKAPDGSDRLVLNVSKDALSSAPDFTWNEALNNAGAEVGAQNDAQSQAQNVAPNANDTSNVSPSATTDMPGARHVDRAALQPIDTSALTAEDLNGISVYGTDDELIGTIGDFVLDANGKIDAVVVDVGGFLGLGQKPVAVGFENLSFSVDANGNRYLFLNASRQVLEEQPPFDKSTYTADRSAQRLVLQP